MPLLGKLGVVETGVRRLEIGATILLVGIEEELIEPAIEIVVSRDVATRPAAPIELVEMADEIPCPPFPGRQARRQHLRLAHQDREQVGKGTLLDDELAIHE